MAIGSTFGVSGLDQRKQLLSQALDQNHVTDPTRRAQMLATGLIEGDLSQSSRDASKDGSSSANYSPLNLNDGMIRDLGLTAVEPMLNSSDLATSYNAAIEVVNAALDKYGSLGFEEWQRGGQGLVAEGQAAGSDGNFAPYNKAFQDTVNWVESSPSATSDNQRFEEEVPYLGG